MERRLAALGLAVLVLALGGSAVAPQRSPVRHSGYALAMAPTLRPRVRGQHPYGPPPVPVPAPVVARGTGPSGSLRTTGSAAVALTFDDGPGGYTPAVLDLLAQYHIKATFCLIGRQVAAYAQIVRRIVAEGHTLCNHTWDHDLLLRTRAPDRIRAELQRTNDAIHAVVPDAQIKYFRNPGGEYSPETVAVAASLGMTSLYWNVDPSDWRKPGIGPIIGNVLGHTGPGAIVLMHDGGGDRSETLAALRVILPNLVRRYQLIPLPG
jgi:peptidoglycan-N-acetylglucosamine deacetylase